VSVIPQAKEDINIMSLSSRMSQRMRNMQVEDQKELDEIEWHRSQKQSKNEIDIRNHPHLWQIAQM